MASTLAVDVRSGTNTIPRTPSVCIAEATAAPWLPLDAATQPLARCSSSSVNSLLNAPLILNEPVSCWFSSFNHTLASHISLKYGEYSSGVSRTCAAMRVAARATSAGSRARSIRAPSGATSIGPFSGAVFRAPRCGGRGRRRRSACRDDRRLSAEPHGPESSRVGRHRI